jgi:hypothetical protein
MQDEPGADRFTLIHGREGQFGLPHAWIEIGDGRVYDPVHDQYVATDEYMQSAEIERRYTQAEARRMMLEANHSGPWHVAPILEAALRTPEGIAWLAKVADRTRKHK